MEQKERACHTASAKGAKDDDSSDEEWVPDDAKASDDDDDDDEIGEPDADELGALRATAASGETTALLTREESDGALTRHTAAQSAALAAATARGGTVDDLRAASFDVSRKVSGARSPSSVRAHSQKRCCEARVRGGESEIRG